MVSPKHSYYSNKYSANLPTYLSHEKTSTSHSELEVEIQPKRNVKVKEATTDSAHGQGENSSDIFRTVSY